MKIKPLIHSFINGLIMWLIVFFAIAAIILLGLYSLFAGFHTAFAK